MSEEGKLEMVDRKTPDHRVHIPTLLTDVRLEQLIGFRFCVHKGHRTTRELAERMNFSMDDDG
jgi:hypothetical protein